MNIFEEGGEWGEEGFRVNGGVTCRMEAVCDPNANLPPEGGHSSKGFSGGGEDFGSVEERGSYEDLGEVSCGSWIEAFA